jgi:hypothetical protein
MDPGLAAKGVFGMGLLISLQTVFSFFWDDARFYNPASYLVCFPPLLVWAAVTLRSRPSQGKLRLALAALAALAMLPVYHRQDDAALLLLTIPACAMLWTEGGLTRRLALLVVAAGIVLSGDLPWTILLGVIGSLRLSGTGLSGRILTSAQVFPIPLTLLIVGVFYLWVYARRDSAASPAKPASTKSPEIAAESSFSQPV